MNLYNESYYPNGKRMISSETFDNGKKIVKFYSSSGHLYTNHLMKINGEIIFGEYYNESGSKIKLYKKQYYL